MRWLLVFTVVLLISSTVPVLAEEAPQAPSEPAGFIPPTAEEEEVAANQVPDARDISDAIGEAEREEAEQKKWLASPEAREQREESQLAFAGLSAGESEVLLRSVFGEQLEALNTDPGRFLSDAQLVRPLGESGALVKDEGEGSLLETTVPVRTEDEEGDLAKVDLSLEPTQGGFQTENAIADLVLPTSADEAIQVGEEGVEIAQGGAADSSASRFGDKNIFYPSVLPDTDLMVAANSFGAELYDLLRSKDSPEDLRFDIAVPEGAELRSDERGGAEVVREGERLTLIPKPYALDAQGTEIPVQMEIEGSSLLVHVAHREDDYAYPALLDPIVEDWVNQGNNWYGGNNWGALTSGAWKFTRNNSNISEPNGEICCWEGSHAGLLINMRAAFYGPEQFGQWAYSTANEKVYITHVWLIPFNRADMGCGSAQPHDYAGLWNPGDVWSPIWLNFAKSYGNLGGDGVGHALVIGEGSGPPGVWLACNRLLYAGGVGIWLNDDWGPVIHSAGVPSGSWIGDQKPADVSVSSGDEGLGVQFVKILNEGKGEIATDRVDNCTGLYGARCPNEHTSQFDITGNSFGEGIRSATVTVFDPTGKAAESHFTTMVDNSVPEVALSGQLAKETKTEVGFSDGEPDQSVGEDKLKLAVYKLHIEAKDGELKEDKTKRSGVKDVRVFLDGNEMEVTWKENPSCPATSCAMDVTYPLVLSEVVKTGGVHKLEVRAEDFVGETKARHIEFEYFPATGMKDEYVMQRFPLPDGQGSEAEEEHPARPELAVNVMNGNLVYRERDIKVPGPAVSLEVERFYNSMLPDSENTEWGDGWTLAQTPDLEPLKSEGSPTPDEADLLSNSGALESGVELPTNSGEEVFDPALQSTLTKKPSGGYELTDESGESSTSVSFNENGRTEARLTEGYAKVDYSYEGGSLAQIAVDDPASAGGGPPEEAEAPLHSADLPVYAESFGSSGSENGQLKAPGDVAIDSQGNLWVVDSTNNRIEEFNSKGQYLTKFGTVGSGNGQLRRPVAIAVAANDDLLVADAMNQRIQRFNSKGEYLSQFGSKGTANGQFGGTLLGGPEGIAIDAAGNIWVADTINGRIEKFNSKGEFLKAIGSKGTGAGQLTQPMGLAFDAGGNLWTAEYGNNRLTVFNGSGEYLSQVGSAGSGNGQFNHPDAIEIDSHGNVWVSDVSNARVERFDVAGQYQGQFGTKGSGAGQFNLVYATGITTDDSGNIWVTDTSNNRVQKWVVPRYRSTYSDVIYDDAFGSSGSADGQLNNPADVAIDSAGNSWVVDRSNHRIEKFNSKGEFVSKFGSLGTGNGQLKFPTAIAIDSAGNILVADAGNSRIEKFNSQGEYLSQFGTKGSANGQFGGTILSTGPEGLAIDAAGNIWVADTVNGRLEKFGPAGEFIKVVGSKGSGTGQFGKPCGIDIGPGGKIWVADWQYNRVSVFNNAGEYLSQFGSVGAANGQFNHPAAIDVDAKGNIWVGDAGNNRVQLFDRESVYTDQFGSPGSGEGQLSLAAPMGIATDASGGVWVTDTTHGRVQKWVAGNYFPDLEEEMVESGDPAVEVDVSAGLVDSVSGEEAGLHEYTHSGDLLTAHTGPQGKTAYEYDSANRLTKVTLPNKTWGSVAYFADNRVQSVTVSVEGAKAKTTTFTYKDDSPRRTTVVPSDAPHVVYDIGDDGSVFKWWNEKLPPELDLDGVLYDNREKDGFFWEGARLLEARANSAEGIASIDVIANGDTLVNEEVCPYPNVLECPALKSEWITEADLHAPGHLELEVIATDRTGETTSERFWVNVPKPVPLAPGTPVPPRFRDISRFREEYGLEVVFPVANKTERNERIFDLIKAWNEPNTPAGQVARATMERWGVPLRPADVAEMEYRETYLEQAGMLIPDWMDSHAGSTYAGYYIDQPAGGVLRLGFTSDQASQVEAFKSGSGFMAPGRVQTYTTTPTQSVANLSGLQADIAPTNTWHASIFGLVTRVGLNLQTSRVTVGATNVSQVSNFITSTYGANAPVTVYSDTLSQPMARYSRSGPIEGGQHIKWQGVDTAIRCTAGFGAAERRGTNVTGKPIKVSFVLTAGHCFNNGWTIGRPGSGSDKEPAEIGTVTRRSLGIKQEEFETDAEAIKLNEENLVPRRVYVSDGREPAVTGVAKPYGGMRVCVSGAESNYLNCGNLRSTAEAVYYVHEVGYDGPMWQVAINPDRETNYIKGDSGAPVWQPSTGRAVGLYDFGPAPPMITTLEPPRLPDKGPYPYFKHTTPGQAPGILHAPALDDPAGSTGELYVTTMP